MLVQLLRKVKVWKLARSMGYRDILKNLIAWFKTRNVYALMIVSATVCLLLQGFTEYNVGNSAVIKMYWLVLGLLVVLSEFYKKETNI